MHALQLAAAPNEALTETRRVPGAAEAAAGGLDVPAVARRDNVVEDSSYLPGSKP